MIFVDDRRIDFTSFPDGTSSIRIAPKLDFTFFAMGKSAYFIRWMYDNDAECMQLWYLVKHLKSAGNPLFKNYADQKPSLNPPFSSVYVCKGMLPKQIIFEEIQKTS